MDAKEMLEALKDVGKQKTEFVKNLSRRVWIGGAVWYILKNGEVIAVPYDSDTRVSGVPQIKTKEHYELARKLYGVKGEVIY